MVLKATLTNMTRWNFNIISLIFQNHISLKHIKIEIYFSDTFFSTSFPLPKQLISAAKEK